MKSTAKKILSVLFLIFLFHHSIFSQRMEPKFQKLSLQNGIAYDLTFTMIQDSKGFIWFGTMHGLVKYDGENNSVFRHNPLDSTSISFDDIISLYEDSNGNIWIGTWGGGLNKLNPETNEFKRFLSTEENSINDGIVWSISEDINGIMWFATETGGLNRYDPATGDFTYFTFDEYQKKGLTSNFINELFIDSNENLWVGTSNALLKFDRKNKSFINFNDIVDEKIISSMVHSIYEDQNKKLWIGTSNGLIKYSSDNNFSIYKNNPDSSGSLSDNRTITITEDKKNNIWIGTPNGLNKYDRKNDNFKSFYNDPADPYSISNNSIRSLFVDQSGILWISAYNGGINKLLPDTDKFNHFVFDPSNQNSLSDNNVRTVSGDRNGNIFVGTFGKGVNKINLQTGEISKISVDPSDGKVRGHNFINSLAYGNDDQLYVGSYSWLKIINTQTGKIKIPKLIVDGDSTIPKISVTSLFFDSDSTWWIGTYGYGLFKYNGEFNKYTFDESDPAKNTLNYILSINEDSNGYIWIGTYGGLIKLNDESEDFITYQHKLNNPKSLSNNYVFSIHEDQTGILWIGTSNGLNKFNSAFENFDHYYEKEGLPNPVINGILEDDKGNLWVSTNKGISKFSLIDNSFTNFFENDGLQGNIFHPGAYYRDYNDNLYFGGKNGLSSFNPSKIELSNYEPPVYITSLNSFDDEGNKEEFIYKTDKLKFDYSNNNIEFEFASLDYKNPEKNRYKYKLEGEDNNYISAETSNKAVYTNLAPGDYTFKVIGSNSDGKWSTNETSISFTINPPFYLTWWFFLVSGILLAGVIAAVHIASTRKRIKRAVEIEKIREEEKEKVRKQTARDFHDELGHRLTRISLLTEMIKRKLPVELTDIKNLLDKIGENSAELYSGTKDFIWSIDPDKDTLYDLIVRLKDFGDELFTESDVYFEVAGIDRNYRRTHLSMDFRRHLSLIFKEGMNNSLKYSRGQKVSFISKLKGRELEITLSDNGKGFMIEDSKSEGNGLKNMRKRAEKLHGDLYIESEPGLGTKLIFKGKIPKKSVHYNLN